MKFLLSALFLLFCSHLSAQHFVDVFWDMTFMYESYHWGDVSKTIYRLNPDSTMDKIQVPVPDHISFESKPRPKIRYGKIWISNGTKIWSRCLDAPNEEAWEQLKLPAGIDNFCDFDIISDTEGVVCGTSWNALDDNEDIPWQDRYPVLTDLHFIFNYHTGETTKSIETFDTRTINLKEDDNTIAFRLWKLVETKIYRFDPFLLIAGTFSGEVTVLNTDTGRFVKHNAIHESQLPADPKEAVNNDRAIAWIGPLGGDEALICYRMWVVPYNNPSKPLGVHCFQTFNMRTGKLTFEGSNFRGREAERHLTLFAENGELLSVRDVIAERCGQSATATASEREAESTESSEQD